ncbi:MAG: DNA (cytosine-5-)-methyltransferase [Defluviitaleaceae bacterium]|nr:DNA (cytosine-5-)-methyltransferase [Defluviitaleaceae bacterium]
MSSRPLRIFEAFAGIGSQATALKRLGANYKVVGISEWMIDAVICYDAIHNFGESFTGLPDYDAQLAYLSQFEFSRDSTTKTNLKTLSPEMIERLYIANKRSNNFGSIAQLTGLSMPKCDLLVYSFPCQDLSTGGNGHGMKKGSGTRSSLLWEIERILKELQALDKLPKYLLMENVRVILSDTFKEDLGAFLSFLESIGYANDSHMLLNALDFGIPQDRVRVFVVSKLGKRPLQISKTIHHSKKSREFDATQFIRLNYDREVLRNEANIAQLNATPSRLVMWNKNGMVADANTTIKTITCNMDRTHTAALFEYEGALGNTFRRLTTREAFLFMGFTEEEYERTIHLELTYRRMNRLIGNSIVVNVLTEIFRNMFVGRYNVEKITKPDSLGGDS